MKFLLEALDLTLTLHGLLLLLYQNHLHLSFFFHELLKKCSIALSFRFSITERVVIKATILIIVAPVSPAIVRKRIIRAIVSPRGRVGTAGSLATLLPLLILTTSDPF